MLYIFEKKIHSVWKFREETSQPKLEWTTKQILIFFMCLKFMLSKFQLIYLLNITEALPSAESFYYSEHRTRGEEKKNETSWYEQTCVTLKNREQKARELFNEI